MDSGVRENEARLMSDELASYVDAQLLRLQTARLDARNRVALEDLFAHRNPYFLRATRKAPWELVQYCLESHLLSVDEALFAEYVSEISTYATQHGQKLPESGAMLELPPLDDLPLRFEIDDEWGCLYNRLSYRFYEELCDEESRVDWEKVNRFISELNVTATSQESVDDLA